MIGHRMRSIQLLLLLGAVGCSNPTPGWALDSVFLVPANQDVTGTVSWNVYSNRWEKNFKEKHFLCSIVATFDARASATDCEGCVAAFEVEPVITDGDCSPAMMELPLFTSTQRVGIGGLTADGPYPDASSEAWVDYGNGWERHGWAHPEAVAHGQTPASFTWDGTEAFSFVPAAAWEL